MAPHAASFRFYSERPLGVRGQRELAGREERFKAKT
jgi:hypothetical protein